MTAAQNLASELERDQNQAALHPQDDATSSPDAAVDPSAANAAAADVTATNAAEAYSQEGAAVAAGANKAVTATEQDDLSQFAENPYVSPVRTTDQDLDQLHSIGEILRYHRQRAGLSLQDVACKLRARPTTIDDIERDRLVNQTSADFALNMISRYSILLGLNFEEMSEIYLRQVGEQVVIEQKKNKKKVTDRYMSRNWFIVVLIIVMAFVAYLVLGDDNNENPDMEQKEQELQTLVKNGSEQLAPLDTSMPLISSDSANANSANAASGEEAVILEEPSNEQAPQVQVVDENTAKAEAQARALAQDAQQAAAQQQQEEQARPAPQDSLLLPHDPTATTTNAAGSGQTTVDAPVSDTTALQAPANGKSVEEQAREAALRLSAAENNAAQGNVPAENATATEQAKPEEQAPAPELSSNLRNISSQVKVVDRDGLASLNRAVIQVKRDVALRVLDSSNRVLASGHYKAGDRVAVTGIPPIKVQLSDTDAVSVSYMGGSINMPKSQQVQFELPMR